MTSHLVYAVLFLATALYAVALHHWRRLEPDWTWLEVVIGTSLVLAAPATLGELGELASWQDYQHAVWRSFIVGGLPVVVWQIWLAWSRRGELIIYLRGRHEQRAKALADQGGGDPAGDRGGGEGYSTAEQGSPAGAQD